MKFPDFLVEQLGHQGPVLVCGDKAGQMAKILGDKGLMVYWLVNPKEEIQLELEKIHPRLKILKSSILALPFTEHLQAVILAHYLDRIQRFFWHALPEILWRALRPDGIVAMTETRSRLKEEYLKEMDRLMRESRFIRDFIAGPGFDFPQLFELIGGIWRKPPPLMEDVKADIAP
ncbi:MAG: hypothetical protein N2110_06175 [Flavobacteriales bacterium]|nr:hypothetical protein [Flavobacteriales bacterium]MCX7768590.1 hypothetical protein [Flavobacteriales bacterium]MDW8409756.1 hypothetical protein [Flavobacteriales bacterium]